MNVPAGMPIPTIFGAIDTCLPIRYRPAAPAGAAADVTLIYRSIVIKPSLAVVVAGSMARGFCDGATGDCDGAAVDTVPPAEESRTETS